MPYTTSYEWHLVSLSALSRPLLCLEFLVEVICGDKRLWPFVGMVFLKLYYRVFLAYAYPLGVSLMDIM